MLAITVGLRNELFIHATAAIAAYKPLAHKLDIALHRASWLSAIERRIMAANSHAIHAIFILIYVRNWKSLRKSCNSATEQSIVRVIRYIGSALHKGDEKRLVLTVNRFAPGS